MVVVKLVVRVVVAKGHRGERKKKRWQRRKGWGGKDFFFFSTLDPIFSLSDHEIKIHL
jgi:hypothetical protein